uniref:Diguanylate cyclase/phosphodiesterase with PAS/PAC sensor(S) n=1 Tax=uncultured microorganism TaxID=358574 RepID=F8UGY7_9ZZZZ|nr:diguanylate cyclase/phosphodiesterase with PAS/PAC sensor(s) [uncultured microorganism]
MMEIGSSLMDVFKHNPLFDNLTIADFRSLSKILVPENFKEGDLIVHEGEQPDKVYVIVSGTASVFKSMQDGVEVFEEEIAILKPGDSIGEVTLLDRQPRSATVRALSSVETVSFHIEQLCSLACHDDSIEAKLKINLSLRLCQYLRNANSNTLSERKRHQVEITTLTNFDVVTGLANQYLFKERLSEHLSCSPDQTFALLQIEIVDYKEVCDALGTDVGDEFLMAISDRLTATLSDVHLIARVGFNQFMMMYTKLTDINAVSSLVSRVLHLFSNAFIARDDNIFTNVYIGISLYPDDGIQPELLIKHAGLALDAAKLNEPNSHAFYNSEMDKLVEERRQLIKALYEAYEGDQFELYYQPQFLLSNNELVGVEALIRWIHPTKGLISPVVFIPIVEQTGMIIKLGTWIFRMACAQAKMWHDAGHSIRVSVNLSALQFMQKNLVNDFKRIISETGVSPNLIELEITESIMISDFDNTIKKIKEFSDLGCVISIDDFGTGYSSLSTLSRLPIQKLKIDQSFVRNIQGTPESKDVIRCIVGLAKGLGLSIIAEGIEKKEQADFLKEIGCDEAQGYLYCKPVPASEFEQMYFKPKD